MFCSHLCLHVDNQSRAGVVLPRPQVEEAVRLVRAAAEHEKMRQKHLTRMKTLRAQLESLEGTKRCEEAKESLHSGVDCRAYYLFVQT